MQGGGVQFVFNTTEGTQSIADSRDVRILALSARIPYYTSAAGARAAAMAMQDQLGGGFKGAVATGLGQYNCRNGYFESLTTASRRSVRPS